jgi:hypothetical protein
MAVTQGRNQLRLSMLCVDHVSQRAEQGVFGTSSAHSPNVQPTNSEILLKTWGDQHWEGMEVFHRCLGSSHRAKRQTEARMCKIFMEMIVNQRTPITHRCSATRIRVKAKDVLPNAHDMMTNGCDIKLSMPTCVACFVFSTTYLRCRPSPSSAATVKTAAYPTKSSLQWTVRDVFSRSKFDEKFNVPELLP